MVTPIRIESLRSRTTENPTLVLTPKGSGKTQLALELLARENGLYFSGNNQDSYEYESSALMASANLLEDSFARDAKHEWEADQPTQQSLASSSAYTSRQRRSEFGIKCVLTAYSCIFSHLGGKEALNPDEWLLIQLFPEHFLGADYFARLCMCNMYICKFHIDYYTILHRASKNLSF